MLTRFFAVLLCILPAISFAQEKPRAILVLDASGSMWGQIDGKAKISIAQDVIGDLLQSLPADQELGLTVYGHRRKGDCGDIETMILPGGDTRNQIMMAVSAIKPKGKTPLSAAVIQAAEALKYTEEKATVILVSDGRETCELDPCAVGRKLEESGVDFTAHVIGFDISNAKDRAELKCLAEETGGTFRTASNADELGQALQVIAAPEPVKITFRAIEGNDGPLIRDQLIWWLGHGEKIIINNTPHDNNFSMDMLAGSGRVEVMRVEDEAVAEAEFMVSDDDMTVTVVLPKVLTPIMLNAPDTASAGSIITITWDDPGNRGRIVDLATPGAKSSDNHGYFYTSHAENNTKTMQVPSRAGVYEIRYKSSIHGKTLVSHTIKVTEIPIKIYAPERTPAGSVIDLKWEGPKVGHVISLAKPGDKTDSNIRYFHLNHVDGNATKMALPSAPGIYELRYKTGVHGNILTSRLIELTNRPVTLNAPDTAPVGTTITITWDGPTPGRIISLAKPNAKTDANIKYFYVGHQDGNSAEMTLPSKPGTYELRYQESILGRILTKRQIQVTEVEASLKAPDQIEVGDTFKVVWDGPNNQISGGGDYIAISMIGSKANAEISYAYTKHSENSTAQMIAPVLPGTYELRYILNGDSNRVLAMQNLVVTPVTASVNFSNPAAAGGRIAVTWQGPARNISGGGDYISLSKPGSKGNDEITYAYVKHGENNIVDLEVPTTPGTYEVRYILNGSNKIILASKNVQVEPVKATLKFTTPAPAGGKLQVTWDGPGGEDYIAIAQPSMKVGDEVTYAYVKRSEGNLLDVNIPKAPGSYEIRYIQTGNQKKILTAMPLDVVPMTAKLQAEKTAVAASTIEVIWQGPAHRHDTIIIAKTGSDTAESFASVAAGSPAGLYAPMLKGDYEIRYIYGPLNKVLATIPLNIQ